MTGMHDCSNVFDLEAWWDDVDDYMKRWHLNDNGIGMTCQIDCTHFRRCRLSRKSPSMYIACKIAYMMDLDLNKYLLEPKDMSFS